MIDLRQFRSEHRQLTERRADQERIVARLQHDVDDGFAQAAAGQGVPPGHQEAVWLLSRAKQDARTIQDKLDRLELRRKEALTARTIDLLRARFGSAVSELEQLATREFDLESGAP